MSGLIVHEWLEQRGGAEKVVDEFMSTFPGAELLVLWNDATDRYPGRSVRETWLSRTALRRHKALALPFMPATWRAASVGSPEWVLVSSHLFAHHVKPMVAVPKLVYAHTPARYIWDPSSDARGRGVAARVGSGVLRPVDRKRAREATAIAANSEYVRDRIQSTWDRDSRVIYPPVDTATIGAVNDWREELSEPEQLELGSLPSGYVLGASRFVEYKRLDAVIEAGETLRLPVVLAGGGPDESRLRALAQEAVVPVHFVRTPSDRLLYALYQRASVFVFPPVEDFGIMPVEAMACGTPVIVNRVGGAGESVAVAQGGEAVDSFSGSDLLRAFDRVGGIDRVELRARTEPFSVERFRAETRGWVQDAIS